MKCNTASKWVDAAAAALPTSMQLVLALELYRRWQEKSKDKTSIVASNAVIGGSRSRRTKYRMLARLQAVGLLEIVQMNSGQAPEIKILDNCHE